MGAWEHGSMGARRIHLVPQEQRLQQSLHPPGRQKSYHPLPPPNHYHRPTEPSPAVHWETSSRAPSGPKRTPFGWASSESTAPYQSPPAPRTRTLAAAPPSLPRSANPNPRPPPHPTPPVLGLSNDGTAQLLDPHRHTRTPPSFPLSRKYKPWPLVTQNSSMPTGWA